MSDLIWLQSWYASQCDGEWEHSHGISIITLDNPGWKVEIDLSGTKYPSLSRPVHEENYGDEVEWLRCWVEDRRFHAACGPQKLADVLEIFRGLVETRKG
jgi:hypothetical protein